MIKLINRIVIFLFTIAVFCGMLWLIANAEQKQLLNRWFNTISHYGQQFGLPIPNIDLATQATRSKNPVLPGQQFEGNRPATCTRVNSKTIDHTLKVYQWDDMQGHLQISDKPPSRDYTNLRVKNLYVDNYFNLNVDSRYADLPAFTQNHVRSGVTKIYKTLANVLKVAELRSIHLKLKFFSDKNQFHTYRKQVAPDTSNKATGFYTSRLNEASIWVVGDKSHITRITLHESSHAITAAMFGGAPTWLNEGLAGFFEKMVITGEQTVTFATNDKHLQLLHTSHLPSLKAHFSQTRNQWYGNKNIDLNYAIDWSLLFYLMKTSDGRNLLRYMLDNIAINYCNSFATETFIEQHYPGGVMALESNWQRWLKSADSEMIRF